MTQVINSADAFVAERQYKTFDVEGFGAVRIQKLRKSELCKFQAWLRPGGKLNDDNLANMDLYLIAASVVDAEGERLFEDDDLETVGEADGEVMDAIAYEIKLLNGYLQEIDVDELLGKSDS